MSENNNEYNDKSIEKCANMMTSSLYKMQLGINSIKDQLATMVELQGALLEEMQKKKE